MIDKRSRKLIDDYWSKYKYVVMERSYSDYKKISQNIGLDNYTYDEFISCINEIVLKDAIKNQAINTMHHIWGYFKKVATNKEKLEFFNMIEKYNSNQIELNKIKKLLKKYAVKYDSKYLLESYYFDY